MSKENQKATSEPSSLSRRKLLEIAAVGAVAYIAGVVGGMTATKPVLPEAITEPKDEELPVPRAKARLVINRELCTTTCRRCELVCSTYNMGDSQPALARLHIDRSREVGIWETGISVPEVCYQCDRPGCFLSCPYNAIKVDEQFGTNARYVDVSQCRGRDCVDKCGSACPFKMISYSPTENVAIKCHLCQGDPQCVKACPVGAIKTIPLPIGKPT